MSINQQIDGYAEDVIRFLDRALREIQPESPEEWQPSYMDHYRASEALTAWQAVNSQDDNARRLSEVSDTLDFWQTEAERYPGHRVTGRLRVLEAALGLAALTARQARDTR